MNTLKSRLISFWKGETVLCIAAVLAFASMLFVPPDAQYINYIDFRTLAILFCLMTVMAGLRAQGVFSLLGQRLLQYSRSVRDVVTVLVLLCFFGSMLITNDVALLTFVPFSFVVLELLGEEERTKLIVPVVAMQTIGANLGSMLTPIGNPQNLYLYSKSAMSMGSFILLMLPYALFSFVLLFVWILLLCRRTQALPALHFAENTEIHDRRRVLMHLALFLVCLLTVMRVISYYASLSAVLLLGLIFDRKAVRNVDYSLLLTFVAFFVFIGNLGRLPAFSSWLKSIFFGREVIVSVAASQVTSNVPAALLLSGFTEQYKDLIIGTNLGGLGTLIASMASLISYRLLVRSDSAQKGRYFRLFTASNLIFLALLLILWYILFRIFCSL